MIQLPLSRSKFELREPTMPAVTRSLDRPRQQAPYFPPPPTSTDDLAAMKAPSRFTFKSQSLFRPSPSLAKSAIIPASKWTSKKCIHQLMLVVQLLLAFTILILAVLFAYCTALPHSQTGFAGPADSTGISTLAPVRTVTATLVPATQNGQIPSHTPYYDRRSDNDKRNDDNAESVDTLSPSKVTSNAKTNLPNLDSSSKTALSFYTATLPLTTLIYTSAALLVTLVRPGTSQNRKIGSIALLRKAADRRRTGLLISFALSVLLLFGWIVNNSYWTFCEITTGRLTRAHVKMCPSQVMYHHMGGLNGVSIGKISLGWLLVIVSTAYLVFLVVKCGIFNSRKHSISAFPIGSGKFSSGSRRARFAISEGEKTDVQRVVIGLGK